MNKSAQLGLGAVMLMFIGIIVGIALIGSVADNQATLTNLQSVTNQTVTFPENGSTLTLNGQALEGSITAVNASDGTAIGAGNFSTANFVSSGTGYALVLTVLDEEYAESSVNLSYSYQPVGYNPDSGSRGIARLPLLFFAFIILAGAVVGIREWLK